MQDQERLEDRIVLVSRSTVLKSRYLSIQTVIYSVFLPALFLNRAGITEVCSLILCLPFLSPVPYKALALQGKSHLDPEESHPA